MRRNKLKLTSSALAAILALQAGTALAQAEPAQAGEQASAIGDIVVTARKREESLQDVPLAISAFTAETLERRNVESLRDLASITPGLTIAEFGAGLLTTPTLRGMTQLNTGASETNVSVFLDGIYIYNNNALDLSIANIERIEVVKGPQSALYGRNSFAGAINYVTRKPGNELAGDIRATIGTDARYAVRAGIEGPIVPDILSVRIAGNYDEFGGTLRDSVTNVDLNGYQKRGAQLSYVFTPAPGLNISGMVYYARNKFDPPAVVFPAYNCAPTTAAPAGNLYYCGEAPDSDEVEIEYPISTDPGVKVRGNDVEVLAANLKAGFQLPIGLFEMTLAHSVIDTFQFRALSRARGGLPFGLSPSPTGPTTINLTLNQGGAQRDRDYSVELRYRSPEDKPFRITLGGFLFSLDRQADGLLGIDISGVPAGRTVTNINNAAANIFARAAGTQDGSSPFFGTTFNSIETLSAFAGAELDIGEAITLSGEVRYTEEQKYQNQPVSFLSNADPDGAAGVRGKWDFVDYRVTGQFRLSDDAQLYGSVATGSKAGGFNSTPILADIPFDPERNTTYEIGFKGSLFDRRVTFDVAAFQVDWSDVQLSAPPTPPGVANVIKNFGEVRVRGVEAQFAARITPNIRINAGLAYSDPKFRSDRSYDLVGAANCLLIPSCAPGVGYVDPITAVFSSTPIAGASRTIRAIDLRGKSLPRQSDWIYNVGGDFDLPLGADATLIGSASYRYESKQFGAVDNLNWIGDRHLLDARLGVRFGAFEVAAYVDNLLDDRTPIIFGSSSYVNSFPPRTVPNLVYTDARTFGLTAALRF